MRGFVEKALRESKRHSSWVNVDEEYEAATQRLVETILAPGSAFLDAFAPFAGRLAEAGMRNGLVRTVLKATLPGVPDVYQGTEAWDLSLVDPDNRRPVPYAALAASLAPGARAADFAADWTDGRIKQATLATLLADRAAAPALYASGDYRPIRASGPDETRIVAFAREAGGEELAVAALRFPASGAPEAGTKIAMPAGEWRELLTARTLTITTDGIVAGELFETLPVAALRRTA